jgi:beta-glucosidase
MTTSAFFQFPQGFLWGCATASHQVEGHNHNDWTEWEKGTGRIWQDIVSDRACEWWTGRYEEDFERAAAMHNNAQRISIEWSRVEPEPGRWDEDALERYREMLKALRARGMAPMVTLHHFTNPVWVGARGGWVWEEAPARFEAFVQKAVAALKDLCSMWCTINEPNVYALNGYSLGIWPPGIRNPNQFLRTLLHLLQGHARAYHAIKAIQPEAQVGLAVHQVHARPLAPAVLNYPAAFVLDLYFNRAFPLAMIDGIARLPINRRVVMPNLAGTLDWIGLQYYQSVRMGFSMASPSTFFIVQRKPKDMPVGPGVWAGLYPEGIHPLIIWLGKRIKKPIYITEFGVPDPDDRIRPGYIARSVHTVWRAVNMGFPVRGMYFWSLLDNFEWAEGYDPRFNFGLYAMDYQTQQRVERPSARLYGEICANNGLSSDMVARYVPELSEQLFPGEPGKTQVKLKAR